MSSNFLSKCFKRLTFYTARSQIVAVNKNFSWSKNFKKHNKTKKHMVFLLLRYEGIICSNWPNFKLMTIIYYDVFFFSSPIKAERKIFRVHDFCHLICLSSYIHCFCGGPESRWREEKILTLLHNISNQTFDQIELHLEGISHGLNFSSHLGMLEGIAL